MINKLILGAITILSLLSVSAAGAHGVHAQEFMQTGNGILDEFFHLVAGHGYWLLLLLVGLASVALRAGVFGLHLQEKRNGRRHIHDHQHKQ